MYLSLRQLWKDIGQANPGISQANPKGPWTRLVSDSLAILEGDQSGYNNKGA